MFGQCQELPPRMFTGALAKRQVGRLWGLFSMPILCGFLEQIKAWPLWGSGSDIDCSEKHCGTLIYRKFPVSSSF